MKRPPRWLRYWGIVPLVLVAGVLALRALLHVPPLERLAIAASEPRDPPGTIARTGSLAVTRGGPIVVAFQSADQARLVVGTKEVRGRGFVKDRIVVPTGPIAIRFAAPPGARLLWSPVGRRGDPEYLGASSLSPEPPDRATFDAPGTARLDGACALALLSIVVGTLLMLARRRLATVSRDTWIALAAITALALVARLVGLGAQGQTWDEDVNWAAGKNYITNVVGLDFAGDSWRWNYEHPPVMKLLAGIGAQFVDGFWLARACSALWVAIGCALLVPIGARLFSLRVGVLAGVIAALLPPLVAHGQIVGHEAPTVLWWTLGIALALGVHDELSTRKTLLLRLAVVGAVVGIAVGSRFVNGLLGPLVALIVVVHAPPRWRRESLLHGAWLLPLATVATFFAVWPRLWSGPIAALQQSLAKLDNLHAVEPFLGEITNKPGPHYFLVYLGATLPVGILAGVVLFVVRAIREERSRRSTLLIAAWFAIPLVIVLSPVKQDGVRYVMPCVLALAMASAAGFDHLLAIIRRIPFAALVGAVALYLAITLARVHPYYLDYYGEHVGGPSTVAAKRWFEIAWWGEGLDRAIAHVNAHAAPRDRIYNGCVTPNHLTWYREDLWAVATAAPHDANWIVHYAPTTRPCSIRRGARPVLEIAADGAPLAIVYRYP